MNLQSQKEEKGLDTVVSSIHKISQEKVIRVRAFTPYFEKFNQIVELSVDIAANLNPR